MTPIALKFSQGWGGGNLYNWF